MVRLFPVVQSTSRRDPPTQRQFATSLLKRAAMKKKTTTEFLASIYRIWMLRYVDVPENVVAALTYAGRHANHKNIIGTPARRYVPVIARVNGRSARTTLLPAGGGHYRMQFNAILRKAARADVGQVVRIELSPDCEPRDLAVPADLRAALKHHPKANKAFANAPPGLRRQILKWMDSAKSEGARMRRIEIVLDRMVERALLSPQRRAQDHG